MILEDKIHIAEKYKRNNIAVYFSSLFFAPVIFSFVFYAFLIFFDRLPLYFNELTKQSLEKLMNEHIAESVYVLAIATIFRIIILWLLLMWTINSLSNILFNKFYYYNIFKSLNWLKVKLFTAFRFKDFAKLCKKNNFVSNEQLSLIKQMQDIGFLVQGSKSIAIKYSDYFRETSDIDFVSENSSSRIINLDKLSNITFNFKDQIIAKSKHNDTEIEVLSPKILPKEFAVYKSGIKVPKLNFMIAMKVHQLLRLYRLKSEGKEIPATKIKNSLLDLGFLLSKSCCLQYRKILWSFKNLSLLNLFSSYHLNTFAFDDFDNIKESLKFANSYIQKIQNIEEVYDFLDKFTDLLKNDKEALFIGKRVNLIIKNKRTIEERYLQNSTALDKSLLALERNFTSNNEKFMYLGKFKKTIELKALQNIINLFENSPDSSLFIDIRKILLLELNEIEEVKNEKI
ncbi:MAG4530 family protein [Mycoplasmopsis agalactiae]|uniref:MAG4530 family protein n=1 Tax=Mycoplasmopsis agalactiae TaxID=2110 RepID=UPI0032EFF9EA